MKKIFVLFLFLMLFLTGCGKEDTTVIGCIVNENDTDFENGINLWIEENLKTEDDKEKLSVSIKKVKDNQSVINSMNELKEEGADIIVSALEDNKAIVENDTEIPVITAKEKIDNNELFFNASLDYNKEAKYLADFIVDELKLRTVAVLYNADESYSKLITEEFKKELKAKEGEISVISSYDNQISDYSSIINGISKYNPQVLLVLDEKERASKVITNAYKTMKLLPTFIGSYQWEGIEEKIQDKNALEGSYYLNGFSLDYPEPGVQLFVKNYENKYNAKPKESSALGYDCINIAYNALEDCEKIKKDNIINSLKFTDYKGVCGEIAFCGNNNAQRSAYISVILGGEKVLYTKLEKEEN